MFGEEEESRERVWVYIVGGTNKRAGPWAGRSEGAAKLCANRRLRWLVTG
jgi:hypothetical protein